MKKCPALRRLAQNNKGSAIITVVISMMFVVALGTALLFAAYMGIQVSVSARNEKDNFYDASAAMDEVKIKIQDQVSAALKTAYSETLVAYAKLQTTNPQDTLYTNFLEELGKSELFEYAYDNVSKTTTITVYIDKLEKALPENATLSGESEAQVGTGEFTIKGLELVYIDGDGYESRIATDLVVKIPDFFTGSSDAGGLGNYAIIAETGFTSGGMGAVIEKGGIFAGPNGIATTGNGDKLSVSGGRIVCAGDIYAYQDSEMILGPEDEETVNYDIWAQEIVSEKGSTVDVNGNTYVADDLVLNSGSDVTLTGQYYGFGSDDADTAGRDDSESSSIFVNSYVPNDETDINGNPLKRKNASLKISGLSQLTLAGISFIDVSSGVATGQSLSAKSDQLAYLIPAEALKNYKTNPCVAEKSGEDYVQPEVNMATVLWTIDGENRTLAYYLDNSDPNGSDYGDIQPYFSPDGIGYFFINFTDQAMANEYFKDYFTAKPDAIKQYLDLYLEMTGSNSTVTVTKGNTYKTISSTWQNILGNSVFPDTQADYLLSRYASLSESPMELYVDTEKLDQSLGEKQFKSGNTVVAIVAKGNYTYSGGTAKVIIATGNVTVNADLEDGIIIAGGTVTVNDSTVSYKKPTEEILAAVCETTTERLSDYLNAGMFSDEGTEKVNEWSPDKLVYYSNWQKN
ncbi:MAG: hypothetical protein EOM14_00465 [Clostridia bacterium]|nr:hypothetical protein [Clostridia bacterium]